ncbi:hypothetical protein BUAM107266_17780 [Burkholderia ambifaria]
MKETDASERRFVVRRALCMGLSGRSGMRWCVRGGG